MRYADFCRSLKLDHVGARQSDLVNDRTRQSVSCELVLIAVISRYSSTGTITSKPRKEAVTDVKRTPLCDAVPTRTMVVIPLSFNIFCNPVSLSPSMNLSTNEITTGSSPFGAIAGTTSPMTGLGNLSGAGLGNRV